MNAGTASSVLAVSLPQRSAVLTNEKGRLALLDGTRLLAAAGIIWVHAATSAQGQFFAPVGTFGVPFYILIAVLFMARGLTKDPEKSLGSYVASRFFRVYVPFLAWSVVYVVLAGAKAVATHETFTVPAWTTLYAGGHQHLWFLPFLMAVTIMGAILVRGLSDSIALRRIAIALLVATGAAFVLLPEPAWVAGRAPMGDMEFWRFALRAMPTACWAIALALGVAMHGHLPRTNALLAIGGAVLLVSALFTETALEMSKGLRAIAGFGCLLVALYPIRLSCVERLGGLGRYSYGVYLSHVIFVRIALMLIERQGITPTLLIDVIVFAFAFASALMLSVLLAKSKYTRWALGE